LAAKNNIGIVGSVLKDLATLSGCGSDRGWSLLCAKERKEIFSSTKVLNEYYIALQIVWGKDE
jgi:hypothetical protein